MQLIRFMAAAALIVRAGPPSYPFQVGETLRYDARIGPMAAGSATISVARLDTERGRQVFVFTMSGGGGAGLRADYAMTSWTGVEAFTSRRFHRRVTLAGRTDDHSFLIVPDSLRYREEGSAQDWVTPAAPLDELALLYYLRTLSLHPGDARALRGYFKNGYNPVLVRVTGRETVTRGDGVAVSCLALRITSAGTTSEVWLSDDARRLPVQLDLPLSLGRVRLVLR